jgi:hypothetical protein
MGKKYFLFYTIFLIGAGASISSCSLFNPPEIIPCYGHIDSIPFIITNSSVQGTSANGINSAWVYVDDNPVGAFQIPSTFPVIATTGQHKIEIVAGVENAGEAGSRLKYPFYTAYVMPGVNLTQGSTTKFKLTTEYASWADIPLLETFDNEITPKFYTVPGIEPSDTSMFIIKKANNPNVYQGISSGEVYLDGAVHVNYYGFSDTFDLNASNPVFMEMNYKSNCAFTVGMYNVYLQGNPIPVVYIDTSTIWKKMYINLQPTIGSSTSQFHEGYRLYFYMNSSGTSAQLYLDNIKLLRYK